MDAPGEPQGAPEPGRKRDRHGLVWELAVVTVALATVAAAVGIPLAMESSGPDEDEARPPGAPPLADTGVNVVGTLPFDGPDDAGTILAKCSTPTVDVTCVERLLGDLLFARGSPAAFGVMAELEPMDGTLASQGHLIAHQLGRQAVVAYGGPRAALLDCPYTMASGCFHGVMQGYLDTLAAVDAPLLRSLCPAGDITWQFQCLHGLGHGLLLFTDYDVLRALDHCDPLGGWLEVESCQGGIVMENLNGYAASQLPASAGGHKHGKPGEPEPTYMIDPADLAYPCNALPEKALRTCWFFQTSVIMHFKPRDYATALQVCQSAPEAYRWNCFNSLGRDISSYEGLEPARASAACSLGTPEQADPCIVGWISAVINHRTNATDGLVACASVSSGLQDACFQQVGASAVLIEGSDGAAALCDTVQAVPQREACRRGVQP